MESGKPSRTARAAAAHRAVHQFAEAGRVFSDPLAIPIIGEQEEALAEEAARNPLARSMRLFIAARTRFAEDALERAVRGGLRQAIVLGAGLDTFAYRTRLTEGMEVYEVDHPATQEWKRQRLAAAHITPTKAVHFVAMDFAKQTLAQTLPAAGFDAHRPAFFTWLGVVPYLEEASIWTTLEWMASLPGGAEVVFDYSDPPHLLGAQSREIHATRMARVASLGEAWLSHFEAADLQSRLLRLGFAEIEDLGPSQIISRYLGGTGSSAPRRGGHVVRARSRPGSR